MRINRHISNPIITVRDIKPSSERFCVIGAFNAGTAVYQYKKILLVRVAEKPISYDDNNYLCPIFNTETKEIEIKEFDKTDKNYDFSDPRIIKVAQGLNYLTSISHIRLARSDDGIHFVVDEKPLISAFDKYSTFGVEDARVTQIDDTYYINFSAASHAGIVTRLLSTKNFIDFEDLGNIFHPDNKDVTIFPEKINGLYYALHRPSTSEYAKPNMWIASSPDLVHWGNNKLLAGVRDNLWDNGRIGAGCVPFLTDEGWVEIYHGATKDNKYCMGAMLLDKNNPHKVLARSTQPFMEPTAKYELDGFFGNVVFSCGLIKDGDILNIYYGATDDSVCLATITLQDIFRHLSICK